MSSWKSQPRLIEGREQTYVKTSSSPNYKTILSLEVFPPKRTASADATYNTLGEFKGITSDFVSVAYGASDSENSQTTPKTVPAIKRKYGIKSVAHIPCLNLIRDNVPLILEQLKEQEIENILVLQGDHTMNREPAGGFRYAADLMEFTRNRGDLNIIDVCYPKGHQESGGLVRDMKHLKDKVDAGVSQLIAQPFFDSEYFYRFRGRMDLIGIHVPVEVGIMPVINEKQIERMVSLYGVRLPRKFISVMGRYGDSPTATRDAGITYAVDQIADLAVDDVDGIHLYIMNNPYIADRVYEPVSRLVASQGGFCLKTDC